MYSKLYVINLNPRVRSYGVFHKAVVKVLEILVMMFCPQQAMAPKIQDVIRCAREGPVIRSLHMCSTRRLRLATGGFDFVHG